jgi:hypothetical protein
MVTTESRRARKERQERLGNVLGGVTLLGLGAYFMMTSRTGMEVTDLWRYWPGFFILAGLPALFLPTDNANQAFGLSITSVGVYFLLHNLGIIPWSFAQVWPLVLILAGLHLLLRSRGCHGDDDPADRGVSENGR